MGPSADLLLLNVTVLTQDPRLPRASAVAVRAGRVAAVGDDALRALRGEGTRVVDGAGGVVVPGFQDAHMHLLALAARMVAVDCSPAAVRSLSELRERIRSATAGMPKGEWVRAWGYDETGLDEPGLLEARHPTRHDLDPAAPDHPVRLKHRSGHATVLNSMALERVGIGAATPDPPSGVIERDAHGEPSGVLLEMDDWLEERVPPLGSASLEEGVRRADAWLRSHGVTCVHDATPTNDGSRWRLLSSLTRRGVLTPRVVFMTGAGVPRDLSDESVEPSLGRAPQAEAGSGAQMVLGPVKVMLTLTTGTLVPSLPELRAMVREAQDRGAAVAVHAVESEAVLAAAGAIDAARGGGATVRHRIEHASECPPEALELIRRSGATVVTNPGFLYRSGDRYQAEVPPATRRWLYRCGAWSQHGIPLAFGSDAPVELPDPAAELYGAVARRSVTGRALNLRERMSAEAALAAHTTGGAGAAGLEAWLGRVAPGMAADLALLDRDPTRVSPEELLGLCVLMTVQGGSVVWEGSASSGSQPS